MIAINGSLFETPFKTFLGLPAAHFANEGFGMTTKIAKIVAPGKTHECTAGSTRIEPIRPSRQVTAHIRTMDRIG